jgi:glycosyltransferase involved in cell wall biosynthesis
MFPYNPDALGGTEYMAKRVNETILPRLPKFSGYRLMILPGAMPEEYISEQPVIMWLHNPLYQLPVAARNLFRNQAFLDDLQWLIVVSDWHRTKMIETTSVDPDRIIVIPNAIDPINHDDSRFERRIDKPIIVHASKQHRGMEILIPALHRIPDDCELWVFNDFYPEEADLPADVAEVVLDPRITYYGNTPRATVMKHFGTAHIHAYGGYWEETSCLVQIEALASGLLTVIGDTAALPETSLNHGMVVPLKGPDFREEDIDGFAYSLSEAVGIVQNGVWIPGSQADEVASFYSWDRAYERWSALHERLQPIPRHNDGLLVVNPYRRVHPDVVTSPTGLDAP